VVSVSLISSPTLNFTTDFSGSWLITLRFILSMHIRPWFCNREVQIIRNSFSELPILPFERSGAMNENTVEDNHHIVEESPLESITRLVAASRFGPGPYTPQAALPSVNGIHQFSKIEAVTPELAVEADPVD
jgi:hypothetical protein